ncbi:unnamed protein product, partial [Colletotrichum noveboracense]
IMSAEGNLSDPAIFGREPEPGSEVEKREYWRGKNGKGGWRVDAVMRRYMDILHRYAAGVEPPARRPLFVPGDDTAWMEEMDQAAAEEDEPARKKRKKDAPGKKASGKKERTNNPNYAAMQPHMFHMLRHFVSKHTDVRDMLARARAGDMEAYEEILSKVERKVADGLVEYEKSDGKMFETEGEGGEEEIVEDGESSKGAVQRCARPWWVVQPIIRPLPKEAMAKGAVSLSKKDKAKLAKENGNGEVNGEKSIEEKVLETDDKLIAG